MKILGIHFAPLNIPLHRRLETFGMFVSCFLIILLPLVSIAGSAYLLFFTSYWWCVCAYFIWIMIDKNTPANGGRPIKWVQSSSVFKYGRDYFPIRATLVPDFKLDPDVNYLGGWFPHGLLPLGIPVGLTSGYGHKELASHRMCTITVNLNFYVPFFRDVLLALGMCNATPKSISYLLNSPNGGKIVLLPIGGSSEALNFKSEEYRIKLKNRKGFIKLAIRNGVPVIPIFSFGENDVFQQVIFPQDSLVRRMQHWIRDKINIAPLIYKGRGIFQYTFGVLPFRKPINIVFGKPLKFPKSENPTQEEVDDAHQQFTKSIVDIFEKYKYFFEKNPETCKLVLE